MTTDTFSTWRSPLRLFAKVSLWAFPGALCLGSAAGILVLWCAGVRPRHPDSPDSLVLAALLASFGITLLAGARSIWRTAKAGFQVIDRAGVHLLGGPEPATIAWDRVEAVLVHRGIVQIFYRRENGRAIVKFQVGADGFRRRRAISVIERCATGLIIDGPRDGSGVWVAQKPELANAS